jgi:hypothetical protein
MVHALAEQEPILQDDPAAPVDWSGATNRLNAGISGRKVRQLELFAISPNVVFRMNVCSAALTNWYDYRLTLRGGAAATAAASLPRVLRAEQVHASGQPADLRWGCLVLDGENKQLFAIYCDDSGTNGVVNGACVRFTTRTFRDWAQGLIAPVYGL